MNIASNESAHSMPPLRDMSEVMEEVMANLERDRKDPLVYFDEVTPERVGVVFTDRDQPGFKYDFYCTKAEVLQWLIHMEPKMWVTKEHLGLFASLARLHFG